ncbi:MAG: hypothetical protein WBL44_10765 [Nitrososphaeraceae archaeon]|jgi:hypothetical protein
MVGGTVERAPQLDLMVGIGYCEMIEAILNITIIIDVKTWIAISNISCPVSIRSMSYDIETSANKS